MEEGPLLKVSILITAAFITQGKTMIPPSFEPGPLTVCSHVMWYCKKKNKIKNALSIGEWDGRAFWS